MMPPLDTIGFIEASSGASAASPLTQARVQRDEANKIANSCDGAVMRIPVRAYEGMSRPCSNLWKKRKENIVWVNAKVFHEIILRAKGDWLSIDRGVESECLPRSPNYPGIKGLGAAVRCPRERFDVLGLSFIRQLAHLASNGKMAVNDERQQRNEDWNQNK